MLKLCCVTLVILWASSSGLTKAQTSYTTPATVQLQEKDPNTIYEVLKVVIEDHAKTLHLSTLPVSMADVHIYSKGVECNRDQDFHIDGQKITLLGDGKADSGDDFHAVYQTQFAHEVKAQARTEAIARYAIIREALREPEAHQASQTLAGEGSRTVQYDRDVEPGARSLQLLKRALETDEISHQLRGGQQQKYLTGSFQGVEGVGDVLLPSDYDPLSSEARALLDSKGENRSTAGKTLPRSLTMLRERLRRSGQNDQQ